MLNLSFCFLLIPCCVCATDFLNLNFSKVQTVDFLFEKKRSIFAGHLSDFNINLGQNLMLYINAFLIVVCVFLKWISKTYITRVVF